MEITPRRILSPKTLPDHLGIKLFALGIVAGGLLGVMKAASTPSDAPLLAASAGPMTFGPFPTAAAHARGPSSSLFSPLSEPASTLSAEPHEATAIAPGGTSNASGPILERRSSGYEPADLDSGLSGTQAALRDAPAGAGQARTGASGFLPSHEPAAAEPAERTLGAASGSRSATPATIPAKGTASKFSGSALSGAKSVARGASAGSAFGLAPAAAAIAAPVFAIEGGQGFAIDGKVGVLRPAALETRGGAAGAGSPESSGGASSGGSGGAIAGSPNEADEDAAPESRPDDAKPSKPAKPRKPAASDGASLSKRVMRRAFKVAHKINSTGGYRFDGFNDCYGFMRRTWDDILSGMGQKKLPVADGPSSAWRPIRDWNQLKRGDVLSTHQGHQWGAHWHGGLYAGKSGGQHMILDNSGSRSAKYRPHPSGLFKYYYSRTHRLLD